MTDSINYTSERIEKLIHPLPRGSKFNTELIFPKYFTFSLNFIHIQNYGIVFFVFLRKYLGKYDQLVTKKIVKKVNPLFYNNKK